MDKSKEYIKMCEKAVEIQSLKNSTLPDGDADEYIGLILHTSSGDTYKVTKNYDIWLPLQHQLQEMADLEGRSWEIEVAYDDEFLNRKYGFTSKYKFFIDGDTDPLCQMDSLELCWLVFVMHDKYHKTWNGEKWIPVKNT